MPRAHLDDLATLLRVVERGGFSPAARDLHLTPGAVSKQISRLETVLGLRLFDRTTRHVRITDDGRAVAAHAREAVGQWDRVLEVAARSRSTLEGPIRITSPAPFGRKYVADAVAAFHRLHPGVVFELHASDRVVDLVRNEFDVAIRIGELPDSNLVVRQLAPNRRLLVAAPSYLRKHRIPLEPADLTSHSCLVFAYPGALQNVWSLKVGRRRARVNVMGALRSDNGEVLRHWCLNGLGISLRETWDVGEELKSGQLRRVLPGWEAEPTTISAVRAHRDGLPRRVEIFLDFLAARWRAPSWGDAT